MQTLTDIIAYLLPAIVVAVTAYYVLKTFLDNEQKKRLAESRKDDRAVTLPLRLQSYERLVLLLERMSPPQLLMRIQPAGLPVHQYQALLLQSIREEFEHNVAQQIYISTQAWTMVKNAKEETARVINLGSAALKEDATASDLARKILDDWSKNEKNAIQATIEFLKTEVRQIIS